MLFVCTRVPVKSLFDYLEGGETLDEFLHQFPSVKREQAVAALEIARESLLTDVVAPIGLRTASGPTNPIACGKSSRALVLTR